MWPLYSSSVKQCIEQENYHIFVCSFLRTYCGGFFRWFHELDCYKYISMDVQRISIVHMLLYMHMIAIPTPL